MKKLLLSAVMVLSSTTLFGSWTAEEAQWINDWADANMPFNYSGIPNCGLTISWEDRSADWLDPLGHIVAKLGGYCEITYTEHGDPVGGYGSGTETLLERYRVKLFTGEILSYEYFCTPAGYTPWTPFPYVEDQGTPIPGSTADYLRLVHGTMDAATFSWPGNIIGLNLDPDGMGPGFFNGLKADIMNSLSSGHAVLLIGENGRVTLIYPVNVPAELPAGILPTEGLA